ncbi:MAG: prephenate dehydrogenase [Firmicutes bacterium]|nr:prephenate dehydrogenase [Bacillota bacterium]
MRDKTEQVKTVGVVGLGLIGGSIAKAYKQAGYTVYGYDLDDKMQAYAKLAGVIDEKLEADGEGIGSLNRCDLVFLAIYPAAAMDYVEKNRKAFQKGGLVMDCCGVKAAVCNACFPIAQEEGFTFVGGHPMAGTERSGIKVSRADLFQGASMVVVPPVFDDIRLLSRVKEALAPLGCAKFKVAKADHHDRMIAYTSQLSHIASNAFVKSPSAVEEDGYSGGSFRDLTRVAYLNEAMWTELFMYNKEPLLKELDILIDSLCAYRKAIEEEDRESLKALLKDGRERKEQLEEKRKK